MDNFKQAVTELTGQEDAGDGKSREQQSASQSAARAVEPLGEDRTAGTAGYDSGEGLVRTGSAPKSTYGGRFSQAMDMAVSKAPVTASSGTVIAAGTVIDGNISSNDDLIIYGVVNGDVLNANKLVIHGEVSGSIEAVDISLVDSIIAGNVVAHNSTEMTKDSCILGDLVTQNVVVSGKVKGNIEAKGSGIFKKESVVMGNVSVGTIVVEGGARMRGFVSTREGDQEVDDDLFPIK